MASQQSFIEPIGNRRAALQVRLRTLVAVLTTALWIGGVGGVLCHELARAPQTVLTPAAPHSPRPPAIVRRATFDTLALANDAYQRFP